MKNEWKSPLRDQGGTATLKESFETGELDDEKPVAMPQGTTARSIAQDNKGDPCDDGDSIRNPRVQQSTLSTRTMLESRAEQWRTVSI